MYRSLLIANKFLLFLTYNADSICDLTSLEVYGLLRSVVIFCCFPIIVPFYKYSKQIFGLSQSLDLNCCTQQENLQHSFRSTTKARHPE